jgi:hypothetical protein
VSWQARYTAHRKAGPFRGQPLRHWLHPQAWAVHWRGACQPSFPPRLSPHSCFNTPQISPVAFSIYRRVSSGGLCFKRTQAAICLRGEIVPSTPHVSHSTVLSFPTCAHFLVSLRVMCHRTSHLDQRHENGASHTTRPRAASVSNAVCSANSSCMWR